MTDLDREINRIKEIIAIHEGRSLISEGAETRNMKAAKHYLYNKLGYDEQQAMKFIGTVKTDIPNSRLAKCKFMLGVVRMACDGQLQDGQTIMSLNKCLKYVASEAHVNEYDNDLNGLSVDEIINRFSGLAQADLENDKAEVGKEAYDASISQYKIVKINSFKEAEQYGQYTSWCVTHYNDMFNSYTSDGEGVFYFCLRNGFEDEPKEIGEGCPLDSYGLSMIAVSINSDGSVNTITCRWNHDNRGNDNIMTPKELSKVINMNFYEVFKPRTKEEIEKARQQKIDEAVQYILENFDETERYKSLKFNTEKGDKVKKDFYSVKVHNVCFIFNPEDIKMYHKLLIDLPFDNVYDRAYDMILVTKNDKYNFVTTNGQLLSPTWFDNADDFSGGLASVKINDKWNFINTKGQFLSNLWFDDIDIFGNGYAKVEKNDKYNFVTTNGKLLSPTWFDYAYGFYEGYAEVKKDGKHNLINTKGQLISPNLWFDKIYDFHDSIAKVEKNDKYNFVTTNGKLLSQTWFDEVDDFYEGWANVKINGKWNFINIKGQIAFPNFWFDKAFDFHEGWAAVQIDHKWNYINPNGQLLSNLWFDDIGYFHDGYGTMEKGGKWNFINTNGQILFPNLWFDHAVPFHDGYAKIKIDHKWNLINMNGQLKYPNLWFDDIGYFFDGYAQVEKDGKWNFINTKGQLVSPNLWFDSIDYINDGHAVVQIGGKREDIPLNR